jgi:hypothetical protein
MSEHMLYDGARLDGGNSRRTVKISAGLGFMRRVVIDQHFSERERLELTNVKLHLLPAGARYYFDGAQNHPQTQTSDGRSVPPALYDVVAAVASSADAPLAATEPAAA